LTLRTFLLGLLVLANVSLAVAQDDEGEYQGPTILDRAGPPVGQRGGQAVDFRPYGDIEGVYDSGLVGVLPAANGQYGVGAEGVAVGFGLMGNRNWQHNSLSVDYRGAYTYYQPNVGFNGLSQYLGLNYTHTFSRRLKFNLRENGGIARYAFGELTYVPLQNADLVGVPANLLFDVPTYFSQTGVDLTYNFTRRLSLDVGGDGFIISYGNTGNGPNQLTLISMHGGTGRANLAYRLTKRQTVSAAYGYSNFGYTNTFGNIQFQSVGLGYAVAISKTWQLATEIGGYRIQSLTLTQVPVDPAIAAIVGNAYATVVTRPVQFIPMYQAALTHKYSHASLAFNYSKTIMPGNGAYLTSKTQNAGVNFSYLGSRRLATSLIAGYSDMSAIGQQIGLFRTEYAGCGLTYKLYDAVHLELRYDYRHFNTGLVNYLTNESRVSLGLAFSPGPAPLAVW
jgi:hypothetical protein